MPKSPLVAQMDAIQLSLHRVFSTRGFRRYGRTYNRSTEGGVVQVINFQMGASDPPGTTYIPGLRENLYGLFAVNLGIFVAEVAQYHVGGVLPKSYAHDYNCCIRARLGELRERGKETWWKITMEAASDVQGLLESRGFPFLDRMSSREAILRELAAARWEPQGNASSPGRIVAAIILAVRGDAETARQLLVEQVEAHSPNRGHPKYVQGLATRLGLNVTVHDGGA